MSDIQEEMKRLYMKAIEKDLERSSTNNLVVGRVIKQEEEINELQDRINKAIEYIEERAKKAGVKLMAREEELLNILKGKE